MKKHKKILVTDRRGLANFYNKQYKTSDSPVGKMTQFNLFKLCWNPQTNSYHPQRIYFNGDVFRKRSYGFKYFQIDEDMEPILNRKGRTGANFYDNAHRINNSLIFDNLKEAQNYILIEEIL